MYNLKLMADWITTHPMLTAGACAAAYVAYEYVTNYVKKDRQRVHGSARWAETKEINKAGMAHKGGEGMILGCDDNGNFIDADTHAVIFAPTRSGKGVGPIISTLLTYRGSIIVNDPKGENYAVTARRRNELGQGVGLLDPWGMCGESESHQCNPLEYFDITSTSIITNVNKLSAAICGNISTEGDNAFFYIAARAFVRFCILYVCVKYTGTDKCNLPSVFRLVYCSKEELMSILDEASNMSQINGRLALIATSLKKTAINEDDEFSKAFQSVLGNAETYFDFMVDPQLEHFFEKNSDDYRNVQDEGATIYIVASPDQEDNASAFLRIVYTMFFQFQYDKRSKKKEKGTLPVLLIADEFAQLKRFSIVKNSISIIAGFGMRLMLFCQNVGQLKEFYGDGGTNDILANATQVYFGISGSDAKDISDRLGTKTVMQKSVNADGKTTMSEAAQALMSPDEIAAMPDTRAIVFTKSMRPLKIRKIKYYEDKRFDGMYDPRPEGLQ